jgi:uncharacterized membrane protein YfcA
VAGPALGAVTRRLWPMMIAVCLGTWAGAGLMTGAGERYGTALLGVALAAYALTGLAAIRFAIAREREPLVGPLTGAVTGLITAATGVFVIPAVPYLQAIGLEKEDLVQALGLSFTVSTLALGLNVAATGAIDVGIAGTTVVALALACSGMWFGQTVRRKLSVDIFRRCFFGGLLVLGLYLALRALA